MRRSRNPTRPSAGAARSASRRRAVWRTLRRSLKDCDEVLRRNPQHFGVLSGYGQIYLRLDQPERALEYFRRALAVNPNLEGVRSAIEELESLLVRQRQRSI